MMDVISGQINSSELGFTISYKAILPEERTGPYPVCTSYMDYQTMIPVGCITLQ